LLLFANLSYYRANSHKIHSSVSCRGTLYNKCDAEKGLVEASLESPAVLGHKQNRATTHWLSMMGAFGHHSDSGVAASLAGNGRGGSSIQATANSRLV